jgi:hydroxymethylpyrimidine pyrophosphatase-like HAD family hydrolase
MIKRVIIFDLDGTVINSEHRTPRNPDGSINLVGFFNKANAENIHKDTLLPLAKFMKQTIASDDFVVVATARNMQEADFDFLENQGIKPNLVLSRNKTEMSKADAELKANKLKKLFNLKQFKTIPKFMFEDNTSVLSRVRELGIVGLNSVKVNERLA